jgi:hypothetical protein
MTKSVKAFAGLPQLLIAGLLRPQEDTQKKQMQRSRPNERNQKSGHPGDDQRV